MVLNYNYDIKYETTDGFYETLDPIPSDAQPTEGYEGLWQAIVGELKTWIGEVDCKHLANYGSNLHKLLGENIDDDFKSQLEFYIEEVMDNYPEIDTWNLKNIKNDRKDYREKLLTAESYNFTLEVIVNNKRISGVVNIG
jgi:hypothetical protein